MNTRRNQGSPPDAASAIRQLARKISAARKRRDTTHRLAKAAKTALKSARKTFKRAKRAAKEARKSLKTFKTDLQQAMLVAKKAAAAEKSRIAREKKRASAKWRGLPQKTAKGAPPAVPSEVATIPLEASVPAATPTPVNPAGT